jgi:hypothetical protein
LSKTVTAEKPACFNRTAIPMPLKPAPMIATLGRSTMRTLLP